MEDVYGTIYIQFLKKDGFFGEKEYPFYLDKRLYWRAKDLLEKDRSLVQIINERGNNYKNAKVNIAKVDFGNTSPYKEGTLFLTHIIEVRDDK